MSRNGSRCRGQTIGQDKNLYVTGFVRANDGDGAALVGVAGVRAVLIVVGGVAAEDTEKRTAVDQATELALGVGDAIALLVGDGDIQVAEVAVVGLQGVRLGDNGQLGGRANGVSLGVHSSASKRYFLML